MLILWERGTSGQCRSCIGISGPLCPSAMEIVPPITAAWVTGEAANALSCGQPQSTLSFSVNIFSKVYFFFWNNKHTFSSVKVETPLSISPSALRGIASPLRSTAEKCSLTCSEEKDFRVAEREKKSQTTKVIWKLHRALTGCWWVPVMNNYWSLGSGS